MSGGQKQTTTSSYSPGQEQLLGLQAGVASSVAPGLQQFVTSLLGGNPQAASGFAASARAPIESATQRAISGILARTPRGGQQQQLVEQARETGGLQEAQVQQDYIQKALQMAAALFGYTPPAQGQTTTQSAAPKFGFALGPFSASF